jgi:hypothetical protein
MTAPSKSTARKATPRKSAVTPTAASGVTPVAGTARTAPHLRQSAPKGSSENPYTDADAKRQAKASPHPSTTAILKHFEYDHLPEGLQKVSKPVCVLAKKMAKELGDGPELTTGLRKLLEAKDCFVRAAL